jgi:hypothetical protein
MVRNSVLDRFSKTFPSKYDKYFLSGIGMMYIGAGLKEFFFAFIDLLRLEISLKSKIWLMELCDKESSIFVLQKMFEFLNKTNPILFATSIEYNYILLVLLSWSYCDC